MGFWDDLSKQLSGRGSESPEPESHLPALPAEGSIDVTVYRELSTLRAQLVRQLREQQKPPLILSWLSQRQRELRHMKRVSEYAGECSKAIAHLVNLAQSASDLENVDLTVRLKRMELEDELEELELKKVKRRLEIRDMQRRSKAGDDNAPRFDTFGDDDEEEKPKPPPFV